MNSFRADDTPAEDIIQEVSSDSLFSAKQIVRVTSAFSFISRNIEWFTLYLSSLTADSVETVFLLEDDSDSYKKTAANTASKKKITALDKKYGFRVTVPELKNYKVPDWAASRANEKYGIKLNKNHAKLVVDNTGYDLMRIDMELDKLATFVYPRKDITVDDINELTLFDRENTIFELLDSLSEQHTKRALKYLGKLLTTGSSPVTILYMIFWHMKKLIKAKIWQSKGKTTDYISRELNTPAYFMKKLLSQAQRFTEDQLRVIMAEVELSDRKSKSGIKPERILEQLLLRLCAGETDRDYLSPVL